MGHYGRGDSLVDGAVETYDSLLIVMINVGVLRAIESGRSTLSSLEKISSLCRISSCGQGNGGECDYRTCVPTTSLNSQHPMIPSGTTVDFRYRTTVSVTYGVGLHDRWGCRPPGKLEKHLKPSPEALYNAVVLGIRSGCDLRSPSIFVEIPEVWGAGLNS